MIYNEKIGNQWFETAVIVNEKSIPFMARIFGKKNLTCDQKWDEENILEIYSIIYRGEIYIYQEITITRIKIDKPDHNKEFYQKVLNTIPSISKKEKICINCEYGLEPRKCFNIDIIALQGGYTKANYVKLSKKDYKFIQEDKNCTGFKMIEKRK